MKCVKCGKKAEIALPHIAACSSCFTGIIQKRVRKEIRINRLVRKNDRLLILDDDTSAAKLAAYLLRVILKPVPLSMQVRKRQYAPGDSIKGNFNKIVLAWTQEDEADYFLDSFFADKVPYYIGHFTLDKKKYIKPLLHVSKKEADLYAKIKNFKFTKSEETDIVKMLDRLNKNHPEIIFNINNNIQKLKYAY